RTRSAAACASCMPRDGAPCGELLRLLIFPALRWGAGRCEGKLGRRPANIASHLWFFCFAMTNLHTTSQPMIPDVGRAIAGAAFAIGLGYFTAVLLARIGGLDRTSAIFACVPGGAAEMAVLGERFGARVDQVAAGQSIRILVVVILLPALYTWSGVHGADL